MVGKLFLKMTNLQAKLTESVEHDYLNLDQILDFGFWKR